MVVLLRSDPGRRVYKYLDSAVCVKLVRRVKPCLATRLCHNRLIFAKPTQIQEGINSLSCETLITQNHFEMAQEAKEEEAKKKAAEEAAAAAAEAEAEKKKSDEGEKCKDGCCGGHEHKHDHKQADGSSHDHSHEHKHDANGGSHDHDHNHSHAEKRKRDGEDGGEGEGHSNGNAPPAKKKPKELVKVTATRHDSKVGGKRGASGLVAQSMSSVVGFCRMITCVHISSNIFKLS